jgi:hypothetical protein
MTYPDGIDALVNVNATDSLAAGGHAARHNSVNTALGEVKDFLGTGTGYRYNSTVYFTSNGTFTKATYPWLRAIRVTCVGGGGGGGGAALVANGGNASAASGGGGGGAAVKFISDIAGLNASVTVTRGAGGAAGAAGNNNGSTGGSSSFGALCAANGGVGGLGCSQQTANQPILAGGNGGVGTTGDVLLTGRNGEHSVIYINAIIRGAEGGSSPFGFNQTAATMTTSGQAGVTGSVYGGGGGGGTNTGVANLGGTARAGGAGGAGIVIVELYA